ELRIQSARSAAEQDRINAALEIKKQADERARQLEARLAEVKQWTTAQFELGERNVIDKPAAMSELMQRWQKQRENEIYKLLQFPETSRGAIESGRALNSLLDGVGPAAVHDLRTRELSPAGALPLHPATD